MRSYTVKENHINSEVSEILVVVNERSFNNISYSTPNMHTHTDTNMNFLSRILKNLSMKLATGF